MSIEVPIPLDINKTRKKSSIDKLGGFPHVITDLARHKTH